MNASRISLGLAHAALWILPLLPASAAAQPAAAPRLGHASFPTSGPAAAQAAFMTGVLYLHSFEYESAEQAFREAERLAPGFAMAYWGEAMTYTHPVWNEQDLESARAALSRLAATPEARRAAAPTAREQRYLEAVEALYGEGSKPRRDTLYSAVMERLVREFPGDLEAKAFYALSLLGLNQGVRDTVTYLRAARYADTVFRADPDHPGGAHYLIHAYDDPFHAGRGLEAARAYSRIAPDAAHAQHMTTHIFLALGMWDEVVSQNTIAMDHTHAMPGHYTAWLVYGLMQQGRWARAEELIGHLRKGLGGSSLRAQHDAAAEIRAYYLLHSEDWRSSVGAWSINYDRTSIRGQLTDQFTNAVIAWRRRDNGELGRAAAQVARLAEALQVDRGPTDQDTRAAQVMVRELGGMQLFLGENSADGVRLVRQAAALEDAMPMDFGPPVIVEPPHEVLGGMLLEVDPRAAQAEFQAALQRTPRRARALIGLVRASVATGDKAIARDAMDQLLKVWHGADPAVLDDLAPLRRQVERLP